MLKETGIDVFHFTFEIFKALEHNQFVRSLAVQVISIYGLETKNLSKVLPVFEKVAVDENWIMRECSAGFIRKLVK